MPPNNEDWRGFEKIKEAGIRVIKAIAMHNDSYDYLLKTFIHEWASTFIFMVI